MSEHLKIERRDGLLSLILDNPNGNRITFSVLEGLREALAEAQRPGTRAVYLRGQGPVFSYGADTREFVSRPPAELFPLMQEYIDILGGFESLDLPTFAAVHGVCSSGGLELALAFDEIWAAAGTQVGFLELNIATPPLAGGVQRIAARAGYARAFELATAGRHYGVEAFERWNIINRVVPIDGFEEKTAEHAQWLAHGPTRAFGGVKKLLRSWEREGVAATDKITINTVAPIMGSRDAAAAIAAAATQGPERQLPVFHGV